jgi:type II secretory pathway pseudopilin PulG
MKRRGGYTIIELLTTVGIIALLLATLLPTLDHAREAARRANCRENLKGIFRAMLAYQGNLGDNDYFPAWSLGPSDQVDTERALWSLVVTEQVETPGSFICPSDRYARKWEGAIERDNPFPDHTDPQTVQSISYSYQVPYHEIDTNRYEVGSPRFELAGDDNLNFAIMADRSPFDSPRTGGGKLLNTASGWSSPNTLEKRQSFIRLLDTDERGQINSPIHRGQGQNVLFRDGHTEWADTPLVGVDGNNIYTRAGADADDPGDGEYLNDLTVGEAMNATRGPRFGWDSFLRTVTY